MSLVDAVRYTTSLKAKNLSTSWKLTNIYDTRKFRKVDSDKHEATDELSDRFTNALNAS